MDEIGAGFQSPRQDLKDAGQFRGSRRSSSRSRSCATSGTSRSTRSCSTRCRRSSISATSVARRRKGAGRRGDRAAGDLRQQPGQAGQRGDAGAVVGGRAHYSDAEQRNDAPAQVLGLRVHDDAVLVRGGCGDLSRRRGAGDRHRRGQPPERGGTTRCGNSYARTGWWRQSASPPRSRSCRCPRSSATAIQKFVWRRLPSLRRFAGLGAETVVVVTGPQGSYDAGAARRIVVDGLRELARAGAERGSALVWSRFIRPWAPTGR